MNPTTLVLRKQNATTTDWSPLETGTIRVTDRRACRVIIRDNLGRSYLNRPVRPGQALRFSARGAAGRHGVEILDAKNQTIAQAQFILKAQTRLTCNRGPYAKLLERLRQLIQLDSETRTRLINGRQYRMLVCWSRDHVYTLKAAKYWETDVLSGMDYWLDSQLPNGMFWDCIYLNPNYPAPTWLGEALGKGWFTYDDGGKYIVRRVPVLADTEYVFTEGVWYAWKATGDDAWLARQLPRLEKALRYMTTDPLRWSRRHGLVRRSFTADEWDFANPHYCAGDHRCIHPGDPTFFFHGNQSGLYAMYWRMAEMYEHLGNPQRAAQLRRDGAALRARANAKLWFKTHYGHMIPEKLPAKQVYKLVGDERDRMSLSTGYTINRGLPTHAMAVKTLKEYQRRRRANADESFAEWWTMDPPYSPAQWPGQHTRTAGCAVGEYMNGGICTIIAGEIAKAAFDHGLENYGTDILDRVWELSERDGGGLHQVYRRLPANVPAPRATFAFVNLRAVVNRGLRHGTGTVEAWTGEGDNDLRHLPTGRQKFGVIEFEVIKPDTNHGCAVLRLDPPAPGGRGSCRAEPGSGSPGGSPSHLVTVPVPNLTGASVYFLHSTAYSAPCHGVVGLYQVHYADGTVAPIHIRAGHEIGHWWNPSDLPNLLDRATTRVAWRGPNPEWKDVGIYMFGWTNPHPAKPITGITLQALPTGKGIMLAAISVSDQPVAFEIKIRSYGLPDCWAHAAVYYAIAEGLAGIEDQGQTFDRVKISPRWPSTPATAAEVTLHYPASGGYCSYRYRDNRRGRLALDLTGSFTQVAVHCLLPSGKKAKSVTLAGAALDFRNTRIEKSNYVDFELAGLPLAEVIIEY